MLSLWEFNHKNCEIKNSQGNTLVGLGIFDALARDISDSETGEFYPALSCCNDQTMADRCTSQGADKVIWSIKANANLNSDCAVLLREGFRTGKIRLLVTEYDANEALKEISIYNKLTPLDQIKIQEPYINTTLLVDELVKLQHDETNGKVKIFEKAGMRKDRYSSLAYNYYVSTQLESKLIRKQSSAIQMDDTFIIKPPNTSGKAVKGFGGRSKKSSWRN